MNKIYFILLLVFSCYSLHAQWGGLGSSNNWNGASPRIWKTFPSMQFITSDKSDDSLTLSSFTYSQETANGSFINEAQFRYHFMHNRFELRRMVPDDSAIFSFELDKEDDDSDGVGQFRVGKGDNDRLEIDPSGIQVWDLFAGGDLYINKLGGNVGIGTTNPLEKLHVEDGRAIVETEIVEDGLFVTFETGYDLYRDAQRKGALSLSQPLLAPDIPTSPSVTLEVFDEGRLKFNTSDETRMTIRNDGSIGVGTLFPLTQFHVEDGRIAVEAETLSDSGPVYLSTGYDLFNGTVNKGGLSYYEPVTTTGTAPHSIGLHATVGGKLTFSTGGSNRMVVHQNGNVGINTNNPAYTLEVNGDGYVSGEFTAMSDLKVKKNIKPISNATELINKLNPVSYQFKNEEFPALHLSNGQRWGVIAQELETVIPDLVADKGSTIDVYGNQVDLKSVNYLDMIPILLKAFQEQNTMIQHQAKLLELQNDRILKLESALR